MARARPASTARRWVTITLAARILTMDWITLAEAILLATRRRSIRSSARLARASRAARRCGATSRIARLRRAYDCMSNAAEKSRCAKVRWAIPPAFGAEWLPPSAEELLIQCRSDGGSDGCFDLWREAAPVAAPALAGPYSVSTLSRSPSAR
eukprot:scaffold4015_cov101-Isochrysis_galbana.AAC.2